MKTNLLIIFSVIFLSCGWSSQTSREQYAHSMNSHKARFLALGDSYTIGESVDEDKRWPVQLAGFLREQKIDVGDPTIIARTGWTTDELDAAITRENPSGPFDLVSLLIGVNNQYRGRSEDEYREQFRALLQRAIGFAGNISGRVVVLSIPDWGVAPFAKDRDTQKIAAEIDLFNNINLEEAKKAGAWYIDVTPVSRKATQDASLIAADGLHPSGTMYAEWARLTLPTALKILKTKR